MLRRFKNSIIAQIFTLGVFTVGFFHEIFRMEFWKDDYTLLYVIQSKAPLFLYPYQHFAKLHAPLYEIFNLNPLGYFIIGLLALFIGSVIFYFLIYEVFSKKMLAFLASLIYLTSPIGIDDTFMATTFMTGNLVLVLLLLGLVFLYKFYKKRKIGYYFISIFSLVFSFEFLPHRTFYLPFVVFLFEVFYFDKKRDSVKAFFLRSLILLLAFIFFFYVSPRVIYPSPPVSGFFKDILDYKLLLNPILTSMNMIYGSFAYFFLETFNFYNKARLIGTAFLIFTLFYSTYFIFRFKKTQGHLVKTFLFSLGYLYLTPLAFYAFSQREISVASFRYLHPGLPAYGLLIICIYLFLYKIVENKKTFRFIPIMFLAIILFTNIYTSEHYIKDFNSRSPYTRQFIKDLTKYIPKLPKKSVIYFKLSEDPAVNYRLIDSIRVGAYNDDAYFAVRYNLGLSDVNPAVTDFKYLLDLVRKKKIDKDKIFAFEYTGFGLTNISQSIRESIGQALEDK